MILAAASERNALLKLPRMKLMTALDSQCSMQDGVVNFSDPNVQAQMDQSLEQLRQNPFVIPGSVSSWWEEMQALNETSPGVCTAFLPCVPPCSILIAMHMFHKHMTSTTFMLIFPTRIHCGQFPTVSQRLIRQQCG